MKTVCKYVSWTLKTDNTFWQGNLDENTIFFSLFLEKPHRVPFLICKIQTQQQDSESLQHF